MAQFYTFAKISPNLPHVLSTCPNSPYLVLCVIYCVIYVSQLCISCFMCYILCHLRVPTVHILFYVLYTVLSTCPNSPYLVLCVIYCVIYVSQLCISCFMCYILCYLRVPTLHTLFYVLYTVLSTCPNSPYLVRRRTDRAGQACQRREGTRGRPQPSHHRTSMRHHRHVVTPPSPATESCATGTSPSESSSPRPRQIPTKFQVQHSFTICGFTYMWHDQIQQPLLLVFFAMILKSAHKFP